ncbi:MAG: hypothetical protein ABSG25_01255 [Bryobacteraceae bacterium]|jgi:hypothetical protein
MWDLRLPAGLFFLGLGIILCTLGIFTPSLKAPLTSANVNLYSGLAMATFGAVMLWLAKRAS